METKHRIVIGDARWMTEVPDESVYLVVTSPPYWQLKDYGSPEQIGFNDTYEGYINNLNLVWQECWRVLHKGCRLCVNIGDQFARSVYYGRYKVIPIRTEIIKFCESAGFDYMGAVIWQKVTTCHTTGGATVMGSYPFPRNGILKLDYEFILIFKKPGAPPKVSRDVRERSRLSDQEWNEYFAGHWNFPGVKQEKHLAMFPEEVPRRLIKMLTFVGETVLDAFLGSGTTSLAAARLERSSIGYEINPDFIPIIRSKVRQAVLPADLEFVRQPPLTIDYEAEIRKLPYIFRDPHRLDKKIDSKAHRFGSRIDGGDEPREAYHRVAQIISPEEIVLKRGVRLRLLGVKARQDRRTDAIRYLTEVAGNQRVVVRLDRHLHDAEGRLLCYLYLWNKTFLNAQLIKRGLADPDLSLEHRLKHKFVAIAGRIPVRTAS